MAQIKFFTGKKEEIDAQLEIGAIDEGDVVLTSNTDEIVFINPSKEKKVMKSKTQQAYTLNGTNLGALEDGATIEAGTSIDELLAMITQKEVPAEYTAPAISLSRVSGTSTGNVEAGTVVDVAVKSTFTKNDAGALTAHKVLKGSEVVVESTSTPLEAASVSFSIGDETIKITSEATYEAGAIKKNNLGQDSPNGAIAAGSIASSGISFTGKRNTFYGTGVGSIPELTSENIRKLGNTKLATSANTVFEIPVSIGQQYVVFAYPSNLRDVNQIMYVETNDTNMAPNFTKTLVNVEGANGHSAIEYKVYTYAMAVPAAASMTFKVTI